MGQFDTQQNGVTRCSATTPYRKFFGASDAVSAVRTIGGGQVFKAGTFLESDGTGMLVAHGTLVEYAFVLFTDGLESGQTLTIAGLTWTAGATGTTIAQLLTAWKDITTSTLYTELAGRTDGGTFTTGMLENYATDLADDNFQILFRANNVLTDYTDIVISGTGAANVTIEVTSGTSNFNKIAGVTMYDVDASRGDVEASVFLEASFWAQDDGYDFLRWAVDTSVDTITLADGSTIPCSAYNTGCKGTSKVARLYKQKFVEGSEFSELGFFNTGDNYGAV